MQKLNKNISDYQLHSNYLRLYDDFPEANELNLSELYLYSYLINKERKSVSFGYDGKNGKCFYDKPDDEFYVATSAKNLTGITWLPNNRKTIYKYLKHLQNLNLINCHRRTHFMAIELPKLHDVIANWIVMCNKRTYVMCNKRTSKMCNKRTYDNKQLTNRTFNVNTINTSNKEKQHTKFNNWISKTHSNYGIDYHSLKLITKFCDYYNLNITTCSDVVKLITESRNAIATKYNISLNAKKSRFESNANIINNLPNELMRLLTLVESPAYTKANFNHYAGFLVNSLKNDFKLWFGVKDNAKDTVKPAMNHHHKIRNPKQVKYQLKELHEMTKPQKLHPTPKSVQIKIQKQLKALNDPNRTNRLAKQQA